MMSARAAISLVKQKSSPEILQLRCRVRPGASKVREGVVAVTDETIELCVSAQPQDGKANAAVLEVLSKVSDRPYRPVFMLIWCRLWVFQNPTCELRMG